MAKFLIIGNRRSLAGYSTKQMCMVIYNDVMHFQDDSWPYPSATWVWNKNQCFDLLSGPVAMIKICLMSANIYLLFYGVLNYHFPLLST